MQPGADDQRILPELDPSKLDRGRFRSVCFAALEAAANARGSGLILGPTGIGKTSIICGLVQMLPKDFKVLVTTEDRNVTQQIYKASSEALPSEKIGLHCKPASNLGRVMVTHLDALKDFTQGRSPTQNTSCAASTAGSATRFTGCPFRRGSLF